MHEVHVNHFGQRSWRTHQRVFRRGTGVDDFEQVIDIALNHIAGVGLVALVFRRSNFFGPLRYRRLP